MAERPVVTDHLKNPTPSKRKFHTMREDNGLVTCTCGSRYFHKRDKPREKWITGHEAKHQGRVFWL